MCQLISGCMHLLFFVINDKIPYQTVGYLLLFVFYNQSMKLPHEK
jgi:hypothetical protein